MFATGIHKELNPSLETIGAAFAIFDKSVELDDYLLVTANSQFEEIINKTIPMAIGRQLKFLLPKYIEKEISACLEVCFKNGKPDETEIIIDRAGQSSWWRLVASPVMRHKSDVKRVIATFIEITEKKVLQQQLSQSYERFEAVVESAYDGVISIDQEYKIKLVNSAAKSMFKLEDKENNVIGKHISMLIPEKFRKNHDAYIDSFSKSGIKSRPMDSRENVVGLRSDGIEFPIEVTISKIEVSRDTEFTAVIRDITEKTRLIRELSVAATTDKLTQINNRRKGIELIEQEMARCRRTDRVFSIAVVDLDHFKQINDKYGHFAGDRILVDFSKRVKELLRTSDMLCRWGGEEFVVMLPETPIADAAVWAERIRAEIANSIVEIEAVGKIKYTVSIGLTEWTPEQNLEDIITKADIGLYSSKAKGRNQVTIECC